MFSLVMIDASLIMCSQLGESLADSFGDKKSVPQYTHRVSLALTSFSSQAGMLQLFAT